MMTACKTCDLIARRDAGEAPPWDQIIRTFHWDLVHSYNTALSGWLVLVARRHVESLADMNSEEAGELGILVQRVSDALQAVTGCSKTYIMQFAEHPDHPHVHIHIVPRMSDQSDEHKGPRIMALLGVEPDQQVSEEEMNRIAHAVRDQLDMTDLDVY